MKRNVVLFLVVVSASSLRAAFERGPQTARGAVAGFASVAILDQASEVFANPATLALHDRHVLSCSYRPATFGMRELSQVAASIELPIPVGVVALSGSRFGYDMYREVTGSVSYAVRALEELSVGTNCNLYSLSIANYGTAHAVGIDLGFLLHLSAMVTWACSVLNINAPTIGEVGEKLPQLFCTGVLYRPAEPAALTIDLIKDVRFPSELRFGLEYAPISFLALRAGISYDPSLTCAGLGMHREFLSLDYALTHHSELGYTHYLTISLFLSGT